MRFGPACTAGNHVLGTVRTDHGRSALLVPRPCPQMALAAYVVYAGADVATRVRGHGAAGVVCARPTTNVTLRSSRRVTIDRNTASTSFGVHGNTQCIVHHADGGSRDDATNCWLTDADPSETITFRPRSTGAPLLDPTEETSNAVEVGGGNGDGAGGNRDGGQGGGHGGGDNERGDDADDATGFVSSIWPGWRRRVLADPEFPFKVLMEETVGLGLAASGMIAARGKEILNELDFAICDIAVGATLNFILVYLLSPVAPAVGATAVSKSAFARFTSSLPANMFAPGVFTVSQRAQGFLYKGALFAVCGFAGSLVGTSLSQALLTIRKVVAPDSVKTNKQLPNVAINSAAWAGFMLLSSNPRYQALAGIERVMFKYAPEVVAKTGCGAARTANNVLGGANWVWWAKYLGIQDSGK